MKKRQITIVGNEEIRPVLKTLPLLNFTNVSDGKILSTESFLGGDKGGVFAHLWGTWCAPCEKELPDFIDFAKKFQNLSFLLISVNDELFKVKKFIKKFGKLPVNIYVLMDHENKALDHFGSGKVPETFLFDKQGNFRDRFLGPQNWIEQKYSLRVHNALRI
jgi:thiol-disulfide isomerase/thioredoxin